MADHDFQVILKHENKLPQDVFINTLHFDVVNLDSIEGTCDGIADAYTTKLMPRMSSAIDGMTIRVYDPGANPGGPSFSKDYAFPGGATKGPGELACCLSYASVDDPEASLPRRRGRIYCGPLYASVSERPDVNLRTAVLDFGTALAAVGFASNTTWKLYSKTDKAYAKIESIWVDDAWDIQRRRGLAPSLRDVRDVQ